MPNKRLLLRRRKAAKNTQKITRTMEMISLAYLQRAQHAVVSARPYSEALRGAVRVLAAAGAKVEHPLLAVRTPAKSAVVVVIASDRGLCGGFNMNIVGRAEKLLARLAAENCKASVIAVGKQAARIPDMHGASVERVIAGVAHKPRFVDAEGLAGELMDRYSSAAVDAAYIVHSEYHSLMSHGVAETRLLPMDGPAAGGDGGQARGKAVVDVIFHPDAERILAAALPLMVKNAVFFALLQNAAGEHAARRLAMKNATEAAGEMISRITRTYNRTRQAMITREIAEIVGGAEAL
jgi:F-type H+-transporting ATPase subunit gamma